jgi:hypothetical protein
MLRGFYLLFLFSIGPFWAFGQTFFPVGGPLHVQEVALEQANEAFIYFDNPSGDTLNLRWRRLEVNMPDAWDIDLCDYGTCYIGIPSNAQMSPVYDTIQPYLKLIVQPGQTPGTAWLWFRVYEDGNDTNFQDVYFSLNTPGVTSTGAEPKSTLLAIFPNPAHDMLTLQSENGDVRPARIVDGAGRTVWEGIHAGTTQLSTQSWPSGLYILELGGDKRKIIITH